MNNAARVKFLIFLMHFAHLWRDSVVSAGWETSLVPRTGAAGRKKGMICRYGSSCRFRKLRQALKRRSGSSARINAAIATERVLILPTELRSVQYAMVRGR